MKKRTCTIDGCGRPHKGLGLCSMHYQRFKKSGSTEVKSRPSEEERFRSKCSVQSESGCWIWSGTFWPNGYGMFALQRVPGEPARYVLAHRYSFELNGGVIPEGLVIDHLCRVRACVNPSHLEPVTNRENLVRGEGFVGQQARRTHCARGGHSLSGENLVVDRNGWRSCRTCRKETAWAAGQRRTARRRLERQRSAA